MSSPRWAKVWRDVWSNKARSILVVLSIVVGVLATGVILSSRAVLAREVTSAYLATNPAHACIYSERLDDDIIASVERMPEVAASKGRISHYTRVQVGPEQWRTLELVAVPDYGDMRLGVVRPQESAWPPPRNQILVERAALPLCTPDRNAGIGDTIHLETTDGEPYDLRIAGTVHDLNQFPAPLGDIVYGYVTLDTLEWLGMSREFNVLHITVAEKTTDQKHIQAVSKLVQAKLERSGRQVYGTYVPVPGIHPSDQFLQPIFLALTAIGVLSLGLSGFLVINTISAILTQQVRQIGVMKAVGARRGQVAGMYLAMTAVYGLAALAIAMPLGLVGTRAFAGYMAGMLNSDITDAHIPVSMLVLQGAVGLVTPVLAALYPVFAGTRLTVRQAMSSYGVSDARASRRRSIRSPIRLGLPRPLVLSLRNTFRRRGRLILTLAALTLAGTIFVSVFSLRAAMLGTVDDALSNFDYDVQLGFGRPYRIEQIQAEAERVPGVVRLEYWGWANVTRLRPDNTQGRNVQLLAPPADTRMIRPVVLQGRWLLPDDDNALVVNSEILRDDADIRVGDEVVLKIDNRETTWAVVGIVRGVMTGPVAYANYPYYARLMNRVGRAWSVYVTGEQHDMASVRSMASTIERSLEAAGMRVSGRELISEVRARAAGQINVIVALLLAMAIFLGFAGGLGMTGTMGINVLERTREIGIMRAIGASDGSIVGIILTEGLVIGAISWGVGTLLSIPVGFALSDMMGNAISRVPYNHTFSVGGAVIWAAAVVAITCLASCLPARRASRLSVREVLAYE